MRQVTHALLTRSPLSCIQASSPATPFDLHVLSTPPAFVLSQDQTLMFNPLSFSVQSSINSSYWLSFFLQFCIVFKILSERFRSPFRSLRGCPSERFAIIPHTYLIVNTFLQTFFTFFQTFLKDEHSTWSYSPSFVLAYIIIRFICWMFMYFSKRTVQFILPKPHFPSFFDFTSFIFQLFSFSFLYISSLTHIFPASLRTVPLYAYLLFPYYKDWKHPLCVI